jgi:hypothetical protein
MGIIRQARDLDGSGYEGRDLPVRYLRNIFSEFHYPAEMPEWLEENKDRIRTPQTVFVFMPDRFSGFAPDGSPVFNRPCIIKAGDVVLYEYGQDWIEVEGGPVFREDGPPAGYAYLDGAILRLPGTTVIPGVPFRWSPMWELTMFNEQISAHNLVINTREGKQVLESIE